MTAAFGTIAGFFARWNWVCELASHFRWQYAWFLLASAVVNFSERRYVACVITIFIAGLNMRAILPLYKGKSGDTEQKRHRVLSANVWFLNRSYDRILHVIRTVRPDIAVFQEVTDECLSALKSLNGDYPFMKAIAIRNRFGLCLLSRVQPDSVQVLCRGSILPSLLVRVQLKEQKLTIIGTHPCAPISPRYTRARNRQLAELADIIRMEEGPIVMLGDLNTTSWSPAFQDLLRSTHLQDSRVGFGVQPTWPAGLRRFGIAIDHCLVSQDIVVHHRRVERNIGSDHHPIVVEFSIAS